MAFEMGPPFHMLRINKRFCLHLNILVDLIINFVFIHISTIAAIATSFQIQFRLNPELNLDIYNLAIYDKNGTVFYEVRKSSNLDNFEKTEQGSECDGCNGGINAEEEGIPVEAVALVPFLLQRYSP